MSRGPPLHCTFFCSRLPVRSPNLNAYAERIVLSFKSECLDRMILFGEASLGRAVNQYLVHYHMERNHQGLNNRLIEPAATGGENSDKVECRERLGGMLKNITTELRLRDVQIVFLLPISAALCPFPGIIYRLTFIRVTRSRSGRS